MPRSPIYRSVALYELTMKALAGRDNHSRRAAVAELIPPEASVVEVCCGPGHLYIDHLAERGTPYTGLDLSPAFIRHLRSRGATAMIWDARDERRLPTADCVVMQGSLYQFLPDARPIVDRMLAAAERRVIVSEAVHNVASRNRALRWVAAHVTDPGTGGQPHRFDADSLARLFETYGERVEAHHVAPGGREEIYVLRAE